MLTAKEQRAYKWIVILCLVLSLVVVFPFRAIFRSTLSNVLEYLIKFLLIPVIMVLLSIKPMKDRNTQKERNKRSKITNMLCYFPVISYGSALVVNIIHTITFGFNSGKMYEVLNVGTHSVLFLLCAAFLVLATIILTKLDAVVLSLKADDQKFFDILVFGSVAIFMVLGFVINIMYHKEFVNTDSFFTGDPVLLFLLITYFLYIVFMGDKALLKIENNEVLSVLKFGEMENKVPSRSTIRSAYLIASDRIEAKKKAAQDQAVKEEAK